LSRIDDYLFFFAVAFLTVLLTGFLTVFLTVFLTTFFLVAIFFLLVKIKTENFVGVKIINACFWG